MNTIKIVASITVDPDNGSGSNVYGSIFFAFLSPIRFRGSVTSKVFTISSSGGSSTLSACPDGLSATVYELTDGSYDADGGRRVTVTHEAGPLLFTSSMEIDIPTTVPFNIADFDHITFPEQHAGNYLYGPAVEGYFVGQTVQIYHNGSLLGDVAAETLYSTSSSYKTKRQNITYPSQAPEDIMGVWELIGPIPELSGNGTVSEPTGGGGTGGGGTGGGGTGGDVWQIRRAVLRRASHVEVKPGTPAIPATPGYWKDVPDPPPPQAQQKFFSLGGTGGLPAGYRIETIQGVSGLPSDAGSLSGGGSLIAIRLPDGSTQVIRV